MSGQHRPGEHSREIDVAVLRARLRRERQLARPDRVYIAHARRRRPLSARRPPWLWWPTVGTVALVMAIMFALAAANPIIEHVQEQRSEQRVARWCISCHGYLQPERDR